MVVSCRSAFGQQAENKQTSLDEGGRQGDAGGMRYARLPIGPAFRLSVLIGAFSGISLQVALASWGEPIKLSEVWAIPVLIAAYGLLAVPFVGLGLALFGLPMTALLRTQARYHWVGLIAVGWGAIAGKIVYYGIVHLLFLGSYDLADLQRVDLGVLYGVPTGVAWWLLQRRSLIAEL